MPRLALVLLASALLFQGRGFGPGMGAGGVGGNALRPVPSGPRTLPRGEVGPPIDIARDPYLRGLGLSSPETERVLALDRGPAGSRLGGGRSGRDPTALLSAEELPKVYFESSDQDRDGWLSYREARDAFELERDAFLVWDSSGDGRVTYAEFLARYEATLARGGIFPTPATLSAAGAAPPRPEDVLRAFDENADERLSLRELSRVLVREGVEIEPRLVIEALDRDGSNDLGLDELPPLVEVLMGGTAEAKRRFERRPKTIDELVARLEPRASGIDKLPEPPRMVGPVSPLRRLDLLGDGWLDPDDLRELQRPLALPVRLSTIAAALDLDGDGRLSLEELRESMR